MNWFYYSRRKLIISSRALDTKVDHVVESVIMFQAILITIDTILKFPDYSSYDSLLKTQFSYLVFLKINLSVSFSKDIATQPARKPESKIESENISKNKCGDQ